MQIKPFSFAIWGALIALIGVSLVIKLDRLNSAQDVHFYIVSPTYNNEKWCIKSLESVVMQNYKNWHLTIIDDCSTDKTAELLKDYIVRYSLQEKVTFISNTRRCNALANQYHAIHNAPDSSVIITLDGDDWFANAYVLNRLVQEYQNPDVWMTYGQYRTYPYCSRGICRAFPEDVLKNNSFRSYRWVHSQPRTFYAWLFKKINKEDLMYEGDFFKMTGDQAFTFPMLEMASRGHIRFIPDILYIYNIATQLNDFKINRELQSEIERVIRNQRRYQPL